MGECARIAFRQKVFTANPFCHWCNGLMVLEPEPGELEDMATIEHLVPRSSGGTDNESNLRLCHKRCNR